MKVMVSLGHIIATTLLFITSTEALFDWLWPPKTPPSSCMMLFEYCRSRYSGSSVCYGKLIDCSEGYLNSPDFVKNLPRPDVCFNELRNCQNNCFDCSACFAVFIGCKERLDSAMVGSRGRMGPIEDSTSKIDDNEAAARKNIPQQEVPAMSQDDDTENDNTVGSSNMPPAVDVGLPGPVVPLNDLFGQPGIYVEDSVGALRGSFETHDEGVQKTFEFKGVSPGEL